MNSDDRRRMLALEIAFPGATTEALAGMTCESDPLEDLRVALVETVEVRDDFSATKWISWLDDRELLADEHAKINALSAGITAELTASRWRQLYARSRLGD